MPYEPEQAARVCHAAIRQLRDEQGFPRGPVWKLLVKEEQRWYVQAVNRAASGWLPSEFHDEWRRELLDAGWTAGPEIDHVKKTHPHLVPWDDLIEPVRRQLFVLQMNTTGMYLEVPPRMSGSSPLPVV